MKIFPLGIALVPPLFLGSAIFFSPPTTVHAAPVTKAYNHTLDAALNAAVVAGKTDAVRDLLKRGADPNAKSPDGADTPLLCLAATIGEPVETTRLLVQAGANLEAVNAQGDTPLASAALVGNVTTIEFLLKAGAKIEANADAGITPLMFAAADGKTEVVRALIKAGANVNARANDGGTPLIYGSVKAAAFSGNLATVTLLVEAGADVGDTLLDGKSAIDLATAGGLNDIATYLETIRKRDEALLQAAAQKDWVAIKAALAAGANPRYQTRLYEDEGDETGAFATAALLLDSKAAGFDEEVAARIIAHSDLEAHDADGETALLTAVINRDLVITRLLLKAGANPNVAQVATGDTPLMIAAQYGTLEMVKQLIASGAKTDAKSLRGETVQSFGQKSIYKDVQAFFATPPAADEDLPALADLVAPAALGPQAGEAVHK